MSSKLGARTKTPTLQLILGDQEPDKNSRPSRCKPPLLPKKSAEECHSPSSQATARCRPASVTPPETERGVLTSETTAYYLVKSNGKWVPISKANLLREDGSTVPRDTDFTTIKGSKVVLFTSKCGPVKAQISNGDEAYFSSDDVTSVQSYEGDEPKSTEALERMARMTSKLFADLTAISQYCKKPDADPRFIDKFLRERKHAYRKHSANVLEDLRHQRSTSLQRSRRELSQCIGNFPSTEEKQLLCDWCRTSRYSVLFSCGHRACRRCSEVHTRCANCKAEFSEMDQKILNFEQYRVKRSSSSTHLQ